jgi:hypothetical protein
MLACNLRLGQRLLLFRQEGLQLLFNVLGLLVLGLSFFELFSQCRDSLLKLFLVVDRLLLLYQQAL